MKKLIRSVLFCVMILALGIGLAACSKSVSAPIQLSVNDQDVLTWKEVTDARAYTVRIKSVESGETKETPTGKNRLSLSDLEVGDYELSVKAVSGSGGLTDSDWSRVLAFTKEFDTGCVYQLINANREYEIVKYGSASGDLVIEDLHRGKPVTSIADKAFRGCGKITSVTIGNNVTSIGESAFMNCVNLTSITIPESVTHIGKSAFQACRSLKSITLPSGVTEINENTFAYCRGLTEVNMGDGVTSIADYAFTACSALPAITIGDSVETIGQYAFSTCDALTEVTFGKGLVTLGEYSFSSNRALETVNFAEESSLKTIGNHSFYNDIMLSSVDVPDGVETIEAYSFNGCTALSHVTIPDTVKTVGGYCFSATKLYMDQDNESNENGYIYADKWVINVRAALAAQDLTAEDPGYEITTTTFKEGTFGIADRALAQMFSLRRIELNSSIKYIGLYSFASCTALWQFRAQDNGLIEIGQRAFYNCPLLTSVYLPQGLETIETLAFMNCTNLTTSNFGTDLIPDSVTRIGQNAFYGTAIFDTSDTSTHVVYMGDWVVGYYLNNASYSVNISLNNNTRGIADYAFNNFSAMATITGLTNVRYIGQGAFWGCSSLGSISLGQNVREIKDYTFSRCVSLFNVSFPQNCEAIGKSAFYGCTMLSSIDISNTRIASIGERAFWGCTNLKTVDLSAHYRDTTTRQYVYTLESIGERAFYGCISLGANTEIAADTGDDTETGEEVEPSEPETEPEQPAEQPVNTNTIVIPYSVKTVSERAFYGCVALENLVFESATDDNDNVLGIEYIGIAAFANDYSLTSLVFPDSLKTVMKNAFYRCYDVTELELGSGIEYIGDYAFEGLAADKIVLPATLNEIGKYAFRRMLNLVSATVPSTVEKVATGVFYECKSATLYLEAEDLPIGWNSMFNPSFRPVIYGSTLSADKTYVTSVTVTGTNVRNSNATDGITVPQREGYDFAGWALTEGGQAEYQGGAAVTTAATGATLYTTWSAISYVIEYELFGGENNSANPLSYTVESDAITLAAPTYEGYEFRGWFIDEKFTRSVTEIAAGSTGAIKLYASWTKVYTITYVMDGGENDPDNPATYTSDSGEIFLVNPYREGYIFMGWYSDPEFKTMVTSISARSAEDYVLYAKWVAE